MDRTFNLTEEDQQLVVQIAEDVKSTAEKFLDLYKIWEDEKADMRVKQELNSALIDFKNSVEDAFSGVKMI